MREWRIPITSQPTSKDSRCNRCEQVRTGVNSISHPSTLCCQTGYWNNSVNCRRKHRKIPQGQNPKDEDIASWGMSWLLIVVKAQGKIWNTDQIQCRKIRRSAQGLNGRCEIHWNLQPKGYEKTGKDGRHDRPATIKVTVIIPFKQAGKSSSHCLTYRKPQPLGVTVQPWFRFLGHQNTCSSRDLWFVKVCIR